MVNKYSIDKTRQDKTRQDNRSSQPKECQVVVLGQMDNTLDHTFESANRVYDKNQLCPTIPTCAGGNIQPKVIEETRCVGGLNDKQWGKQYHQQDRVYKGDIALAQPANLPEGSYKYVMEELKIKQATKEGTISVKVGGCYDAIFPGSTTPRGRVQEGGDVAPTLTAGSNENIHYVETVYRIRKLTPRECWRLMGYTDTDFDKAAFEKKELYIQGSNNKCNVELKAVQEKPIHTDLGSFVSCIINDTESMETLKTIKKLLAERPESERTQNVDFVITKSEGLEHLECAINTTKCITFMGMQCTLTEDKGRLVMVITEQEKKDKQSTEKYMKITTELNLSPLKLYTILILTKQIMTSKIYGSTTLQANIKGNTQIIDVCENSILLKIFDLKMESMSVRVSPSQLYKQAGNAIVKQVLMAIFKQMLPEQK